MKNLLILNFIAFAVLLFSACGQKKENAAEGNAEDSLAVEIADSTLYGVCGEGTMMSTLEVIDDTGKAYTLAIDEENGSEVLGGLFAGDRIAVTYVSENDEMTVTKALNLTTLLGRWTSLDRNFTIHEDGSVESNVQSESRPYTSWSISNMHLVLNADTFNVLSLSADSMQLESNDGVFAFKRQH